MHGGGGGDAISNTSYTLEWRYGNVDVNYHFEQ